MGLGLGARGRVWIFRRGKCEGMLRQLRPKMKIVEVSLLLILLH